MILLIFLFCVMVWIFLPSPNIVEKVEHCRTHDWYEIQDDKGNHQGMICATCKFIAGQE